MRADSFRLGAPIDDSNGERRKYGESLATGPFEKMIRVEHHVNTNPRLTVALEDCDFLHATYEMFSRMPVPNPAAIKASFDAPNAAHNRLRSAYQQLQNKLGLNTF